jgi:hypothetical protein
VIRIFGYSVYYSVSNVPKARMPTSFSYRLTGVAKFLIFSVEGSPRSLLQCKSPVLALRRHAGSTSQSPLLGLKRTLKRRMGERLDSVEESRDAMNLLDSVSRSIQWDLPFGKR